MAPAERAPIREVRSDRPDKDERGNDPVDREKLKAVDLAMGQIEECLRMLHGFVRRSVVDRGCFVHRLHPF